MSDSRVPVKSWLRGSTFRILVRVAEQRNVTVGDVLVHLAEQATASHPVVTRKPSTRITETQQAEIVRLHTEQHLSTWAIAREVNASQPTVLRHLRRLGVMTTARTAAADVNTPTEGTTP